MTNSTGFFLVDKADDSGMIRGAFLAKVRARSWLERVGSPSDRKRLVKPAVSKRCQLFTVFCKGASAAHARALVAGISIVSRPLFDDSAS
jgi:hypothetical protein